MECKCGGELKDSNHIVKTLKYANEWALGYFKDKDLPLNINQKICRCGRSGYKVYSRRGRLLKSNNQ